MWAATEEERGNREPGLPTSCIRQRRHQCRANYHQERYDRQLCCALVILNLMCKQHASISLTVHAYALTVLGLFAFPDETPANNSQLGKFHEVTDAYLYQRETKRKTKEPQTAAAARKNRSSLHPNAFSVLQPPMAPPSC